MHATVPAARIFGRTQHFLCSNDNKLCSNSIRGKTVQHNSKHNPLMTSQRLAAQQGFGQSMHSKIFLKAHAVPEGTKATVTTSTSYRHLTLCRITILYFAMNEGFGRHYKKADLIHMMISPKLCSLQQSIQGLSHSGHIFGMVQYHRHCCNSWSPHQTEHVPV